MDRHLSTLKHTVGWQEREKMDFVRQERKSEGTNAEWRDFAICNKPSIQLSIVSDDVSGKA